MTAIVLENSAIVVIHLKKNHYEILCKYDEWKQLIFPKYLWNR